VVAFATNSSIGDRLRFCCWTLRLSELSKWSRFGSFFSLSKSPIHIHTAAPFRDNGCHPFLCPQAHKRPCHNIWLSLLLLQSMFRDQQKGRRVSFVIKQSRTTLSNEFLQQLTVCCLLLFQTMAHFASVCAGRNSSLVRVLLLPVIPLSRT
jgi:hypothetical protein